MAARSQLGTYPTAASSRTSTPHDGGAAPSLPPQQPARGEDELVARYRATRDPAVREEIVLTCTPLVRRIVADFIFSGVPGDDLMQVGFIGLLNAVEMFDPTRGVKFVTYASHLIRGEIRHYLRDHRDTIRKPRWLQKLNHQIEEAAARYISEEGRFPPLEQLASELNVEEEGLLEALKTREVLRTISLEADEETGDLRVDRDRTRHKSPTATQLPLEDRIVLFEAMEKLNPLQRRVLYYLFFTDLTQMEAARRIGISQKHVSRVLANSLTKLRALLDPAV
ncbi:MAG: sigma-70 family RNA polymerase sigma factor [Armatimonadota bacterium]|nr:sigma-70 family RNA polymerase sigma factor [Armatimonadota bacterium]MDR7464299.1 sigma-70 family RNA polymerase sigma factor [Armatimonadota bacterium]MDR7470163.1 sigma-70 family RNA polymerase sigma factor [Armatimonadota bacterium]MDR7473591.1 sigma-70 family RNA polymerase sigma factor [Armatimonadota bacterium]